MAALLLWQRMLDMSYTVDSAISYRLATQAGHNHLEPAESEQISSWKNVVRHSVVLFIFWSAKPPFGGADCECGPTRLLTKLSCRRVFNSVCVLMDAGVM